MTHAIFTLSLPKWITRFRKRVQQALYVALQALVCLSLIASSAVPAIGAPGLSGSEITARARSSSQQKIQPRNSEPRTRDKIPLPDVQAGSRVWAGPATPVSGFIQAGGGNNAAMGWVMSR